MLTGRMSSSSANPSEGRQACLRLKAYRSSPADQNLDDATGLSIAWPPPQGPIQHECDRQRSLPESGSAEVTHPEVEHPLGEPEPIRMSAHELDLPQNLEAD